MSLKEEKLKLPCLECLHAVGWKWGYCDAYPDGIPDAILEGRVNHRRKHKGDNGITFKEYKDACRT